jgi:four helix bundle protein
VKFENLKVWQKALELTFQVHELTRKFPKEEQFILTAQMKRAADSVCLNIAEGSLGQSDKDFHRFLSISLKSAIELVACLHIGKRREIINDHEFTALYNDIEEIIKMLQGLRNSLKIDGAKYYFEEPGFQYNINSDDH